MKGKRSGRYSPGSVSTRLYEIAEMARRLRGKALTTLAHRIDLAWMYEAWKGTRKDGARGIDRVGAAEYAANLDDNLKALLDRFKTGEYKAPPVRRHHIPKADGKSRPIGIPTLEDKVLQRAVVMALEAVYEQDFLDCSYGFRRGRSQHQALEALRNGLMEMRGGWVVDLDIRAFFDSIDHSKLREILDLRVRDGVIRRAIGKWLKAGVMEEGQLIRADAGTPQGGVISPMLANIYLHEVLDRWFVEQVQPNLRGRSFMVRFADDAVMVFKRREDAERVLEALVGRLAAYGLELHPEKTRVVPFQRPPRGRRADSDRTPPPGSFDFLGFTHYWKKSRRGNNVVGKKTSKSRLRRALQHANEWCRRHRHRPVEVQHAYLCRLVDGHCGYYGVTGNAHSLKRFRHRLERIWKSWLDRRSQRARMTWEKFHRLKRRYPLPEPRVVHSVYRVT